MSTRGVSVSTAIGGRPPDARTVTSSPFFAFLPGAGLTAITVPGDRAETRGDVGLEAELVELLDVLGDLRVLDLRDLDARGRRLLLLRRRRGGGLLLRVGLLLGAAGALRRKTRTAVPRSTRRAAAGIWLRTT